MANNPFNRTLINARERPLSSDVNRAASDADRAIREFLAKFYTGLGATTPPTGFIGNGFRVVPTSPASMSLVAKAGLGFFYDASVASDVSGISGVNDLSVYKPMILNSDLTFTLPAAPGAPNSRYDLLEVKMNRNVGDPTSRDVFNPMTGVFDPTLVNKTLFWDYDGLYGSVNAPANSTAPISLKVGVAGNPPTAPSVSPGYVGVGLILVGSAVASVDADKIVSTRPLLVPGQNLTVSARLYSAPPLYATTVLEALHAPPGVQASVVWKSSGPLTLDVYIISGTPTGIPVFVIPGATFSTPPALVSIDAPMQADLVSVNANPPIKVGIGQTVAKASIVIPTAPAYVNLFASLNG